MVFGDGYHSAFGKSLLRMPFLGVVFGDVYHSASGVKGQQLWEALAVLVALRAWFEVWSEQRSIIHVKSDSMTALTILVTHKASGQSVGLVARELALDIGRATYTPHLVTHIPGVTNILSDYLSRTCDPAHAHDPQPPGLSGAERTLVPTRAHAWYQCLVQESAWLASSASAS